MSFKEEEPAYSGMLHHYKLVEIINRDNWTIEEVEVAVELVQLFKKERAKSMGCIMRTFMSDLKVKKQVRVYRCGAH